MRASLLGNSRVDLEEIQDKVPESRLQIELQACRIEVSANLIIHSERLMLFKFEKKFTAAYMMLLMVSRETGYSPHSKECAAETKHSLVTYYGASSEDAEEWVTSAQLRMLVTGGDDITMMIGNQIKAVFAGEPSVLDMEAPETNE